MIFLKSIVKEDFQWVPKDISQSMLHELVNTTDDFRIAVTMDDGSDRELRMDSLADRYDLSTITTTIETFLENSNEEEFTFHNVTYLSNVRTVKHKLLSEYTCKMGLGNSGYGDGVTIPVPDRKDIVITSDLIGGAPGAIEYFNDNCLFVVNGRVHSTVIVNERLFIIDGGREVQRLVGCVVSVLDFAEIGGIDVHVIKEEDYKSRAFTLHPDNTYRSKVMLTVDDIDIQRKALLMFEAGYYKDDFSVVDSTRISTDVMHASAVKHLLKLMPQVRGKYYDGLQDVSYASEHALDVKRYLTQGDSLIVSLRDSSVIERIETVESMELVGHYRMQRPPCGIMLAEDMSILQYRVTAITDTHSTLCTLPNQVYKYMPDAVLGDLAVSMAPYVTSSIKPEYMSARMVDLYALRD